MLRRASPLPRLRSTGAAAALSFTLGLAQAQTPAPGYGSPAPQPPLQAGGLSPPPAQAPAEAQTLRELQRAEREDAGRGLEFIWLNAEAGYEYITLQSLKSGGLLDASLGQDAGSAFTFGIGAGLRLIFFTVGARFRLARAADWNLWTLNAEAGLHIPLGELEPYVVLSAGYASLGSFSATSALAGLNPADVDVSGFDVRLGGGLDWYVDPLISLGAQGTLEMLALSRSGLGSAAGGAGLYARDGDALGLAVTLTGVVGFHF